jgi:hypothetical protein
VASGTSIATLRDRLVGGWAASQRAIFSLLARGVVTVSRSAAVHTAAWKKVMEDLEVDFVVEATRAIRTSPFLEAVAPTPARPVKSVQRFDEPLDLDIDPRLIPAPPPEPLPFATPEAPAPAAWAPIAPGTARKVASKPGASTAGTGWRGTTRSRSPQAQECLDNGRTELAAGNSHSALAHLRRALQLSPGDAEIAGEIGRAIKRA